MSGIAIAFAALIVICMVGLGLVLFLKGVREKDDSAATDWLDWPARPR